MLMHNVESHQCLKIILCDKHMYIVDIKPHGTVIIDAGHMSLLTMLIICIHIVLLLLIQNHMLGTWHCWQSQWYAYSKLEPRNNRVFTLYNNDLKTKSWKTWHVWEIDIYGFDLNMDTDLNYPLRHGQGPLISSLQQPIVNFIWEGEIFKLGCSYVQRVNFSTLSNSRLASHLKGQYWIRDEPLMSVVDTTMVSQQTWQRGQVCSFQ